MLLTIFMGQGSSRRLLLAAAGLLLVIGLGVGYTVLGKRADAANDAVVSACQDHLNRNPIGGTLAVASFERATVTDTAQGHTVGFDGQRADAGGAMVNTRYTCTVIKAPDGALVVEKIVENR